MANQEEIPKPSPGRETPLSRAAEVTPLKIGVIYASAAAAWIMCSDWLVDLLVQNPEFQRVWMTIRQVGLIGLTSVLLVLLARLHLRRLHALNVALAGNEAHLRQVFENAPVAYQALDREGHILEVSPGCLQLLKIPREEWLGRWFGEFLAPGFVDRFREFFREVVTQRESRHAELDLLQSDGSRLTLSIEGRADMDSAGRVQRVHCVLHDITERRRREEDLRQSETAARAELASVQTRLTESDTRLQSILRVLPAGIGVTRNRMLVEVSGRVCELTGYRLEELLGQDSRLLFATESDGDFLNGSAQRLIQDGAVASTETRWRRRDGEPRDVLLNCCAVDPCKPAAGIAFTVMDITEQKRAQDQLRRLSRAVEQSPVSVVITDLNGTIEYVNPRFTQVTGYTADEVLGRNPRILKSGETPSEDYRQMWKTIASGCEWRGLFHNRTKQGTLFWELASISPLRDSNGDITHYLAIKEDVTAQKFTEERIREQAELLDKTQDAILVINLDRRLRFGNRSAAQFYGQRAEDMPGQLADPLMFPAEPSRCAGVCDIALEKGAWSGEVRHPTGYGQVRTLHSRWSLVRDATGRPKDFLVVNTDITEKKRLEEQFLRAQRMESIGTLASGVAHDLNNILSPILMATELLRQIATDPADQEMLTMLKVSAERGSSIVRQLLTFGRGLEGERTELQPRILLKEMVKVIEETFPKSITLDHQFPEDLWSVHGDPTHIHQVLLNLCVNARDAMPRGGCLTIASENLVLDEDATLTNPEARPGPYVVLEVRDTGSGIPPAILEKIFDPFFTTKEPGKGTGLGLSTVLGIVRSHEGFVQVVSRVGEGTQFKVYVPALAPAHIALAPAVQVELPRGQGELVLVVDDEDAVRRVAQRILEHHGYQVVSASDGAEGLLVFSQRRREVRAVLTDMLMPIVDGGALVRALRRLSPNLPIVAMTGLANSAEDVSGLRVEADAFLHKPFDAEQIVRTLHQVLAGED